MSDMKKIGIFYGSTTGNTAVVAREIAAALNVADADVYDVATTAPSKVGDYDVLILGASTWGAGDIQENMADFIDGLESLDLRGKDVAVFGCGDESMTDTFCDAVGQIYHRLRNTGANFIGDFNTDGYVYKHSDAVKGGRSVGLLIDMVNHPEMTEPKVKAWTEEIMTQI